MEANIASGFIEGEEITIAAEVGGRIEAITVEEGERVTAGQELVRLDRAMLNAQIAQAQAAVDTSKAQLAQINAGTRVEDVRQAQAALTQTLAARDGAKQAWENAKVRARESARAGFTDCCRRGAIQSIQVSTRCGDRECNGARARVDAIGGVDQTRADGKVIVEQWTAAEAAVSSARVMYEGAVKSLQILVDIRKNPITFDSQIDAAKAQADAMSAAADVAQARFDAVKAGATKEQIAIAQAAVKQAEAALGVLQVQSSKMTLKSPINGIVARRAARQAKSPRRTRRY